MPPGTRRKEPPIGSAADPEPPEAPPALATPPGTNRKEPPMGSETDPEPPEAPAAPALPGPPPPHAPDPMQWRWLVGGKEAARGIVLPGPFTAKRIGGLDLDLRSADAPWGSGGAGCRDCGNVQTQAPPVARAEAMAGGEAAEFGSGRTEALAVL